MAQRQYQEDLLPGRRCHQDQQGGGVDQFKSVLEGYTDSSCHPLRPSEETYPGRGGRPWGALGLGSAVS